MARIRVPLPEVGEQRAIATALSDADALIESLDRLIAKKRAIKQAAMQQLLTGQTRLPGFTGEWETKRLGEIGTFYKGQGIRRDDVSDEGVPCIRYGEIYTRYGDCVVAPESSIPEHLSESAFPLRSGDILFAGSGETAEEIGMCVAYLGEQPAFAGGDIVVLRPNGGTSAYLGRLLNHPTIAQQKARVGQGDAVVHISARNLAQIEVHFPDQKEQTAIATVLSDMDSEVEALEHRRYKARQLKQGMMQQLLTGRVRLVEPEVENVREASA
ncbi:restriction endonuclease subunit S [Halomonas piscis]|nr:restriction endonuclease subunit S [Halomonas piscis]